MVDYSVCDTHTLRDHLSNTMPAGAMTAYFQGVYYEEASVEERFREGVDEFVSACNAARITAEGYERCEDHDPNTGIITFYVMREDGVAMAEISAFFLGEDGNVGFHAATFPQVTAK